MDEGQVFAGKEHGIQQGFLSYFRKKHEKAHRGRIMSTDKRNEIS